MVRFYIWELKRDLIFFVSQPSLRFLMGSSGMTNKHETASGLKHNLTNLLENLEDIVQLISTGNQ